MTAALVAGLLAGYGVAVPVGAVAVLIAGLTARTSLRVGAAAALGAATADGLYALVAVVSGAALARRLEPVSGSLRWVAAAVLVAFAGRTCVAALRSRAAPGAGSGLGTPPRAYGGLLAVTLLNPTTVVYFAALVLGRSAGDGPDAVRGTLFVAGAFGASASWQLVLAGGGALVGRVLTGRRGRLATAIASSVLIAGFAAYLIWP